MAEDTEAVAPQEDPMLRLRYYRETGQDAEAQKYERYLRETGQYKEAAGAGNIDLSAKGPTSPAPPAEPPEAHPILAGISRHAANIAQGLPGMEALQAAIMGKMEGVPYNAALADLRGETGKIGGKVKFLERVAGAAPAAMLLPGSPMAGGALLGGADQLLGAEGADKALHGDLGELGKRAAMTGVGAAGGALVGKVMDTGMSAVMAALAKNPEANILARQAARSQVAKRLYDAARTEGNANPVTPQVRAFFAEPDIARRITALQGLDQFKGSAPESPEMIDALAKSLSDEAHAIKKGLNVQDPSKPNTGRFAGQNVGALKDRLMQALSTRGEKPPMFMDVPGTNVSTEPKPPIHFDVPETTAGNKPIMFNAPAEVHETFGPAELRNSAGRLRSDLSGVADAHLEKEWHRLAELNNAEEALHSGVREAGYRSDYEELPRTERLGRRGQEDLPDADGAVDAERLAADNKIITDYNKSRIVRAARAKAIEKIQAELSSREQPTDFNFGANEGTVKPRVGSAPGVRIETPAMRVQTVPGAQVHTAGMRVQTAPAEPGMELTAAPMRVQTAPAEPMSAYMPSYQQASQDFARQSGDIDAVGKGMTALQRATSPIRITAKQISGADPKTPLRFADWAQSAPESQQAAAREGILGDLSNAWQQPQGWTKPEFRTAAKKAGPLLRSIPGRANDLTTLMQQLGLTTANSPFASQ